MNSRRPPRDFLPGVANLFRTAPDLSQDFEANIDIFDQYERLRQLQSLQRRNRQSHAPQTTPQTAPRVADDNGNNNPRNYDGADTDRDSEDDDNDSRHDGDGDAIYDLNSQVPFPKEDSQHKEIQKLLSMPEIDIPPEQRKNTPAAMSCKLMAHQRVSLTWMTQQEEDQHKKGGLLAGIYEIQTLLDRCI